MAIRNIFCFYPHSLEVKKLWWKRSNFFSTSSRYYRILIGLLSSNHLAHVDYIVNFSENLAMNLLFFSMDILQTFWRRQPLGCSELDLEPHHSLHSVSLQERVRAVARCCLNRWHSLLWPWENFGNSSCKSVPCCCCGLQGEGGQTSCFPKVRVTGEDSRLQ